MKKVFLIGDSIRFGAGEKSPGYGVYVKELFEGEAEVFAPDENCRFAQYTLRYLGDWARKTDRNAVDAVHWNNGLWDVLHLDGDEIFTPKDVYVSFLERIARKIGLFFPNAKIIFANNTPVVEAWGHANFMRYNSEIEAYNEAAEKLMAKLGIPVNDLYSLASSFDQSLHADWVHYNAEGSRLLAEQTVRSIRENW